MSEIPKTVFAVYDVNRSLTDEAAFDFAQDQLVPFAESKDESEREILREFLSKIRNSPRKRDLIQVINRTGAQK